MQISKVSFNGFYYDPVITIPNRRIKQLYEEYQRQQDNAKNVKWDVFISEVTDYKTKEEYIKREDRIEGHPAKVTLLPKDPNPIHETYIRKEPSSR